MRFALAFHPFLLFVICHLLLVLLICYLLFVLGHLHNLRLPHFHLQIPR
jgi:hypothetical protein